MISALLVASLVLATNDQPHPRYTTRQCSKGPGGRSVRGAPCDDGAFFEFAPASGRGIGVACACAAVTGAKGETITTTRASSAMCLSSGLSATVGTAVLCSNNLPRVEAAPNGTLALLKEPARTNSLLRSQEFETTWGAFGAGGPAAPTVTANAATAPDGTNTADRVQFAACPTANTQSIVSQSYTGTVATWSAGVFVKGNGGSGQISMSLNDTVLNTANAIQCSYNPTTWTWCGGPPAPLTRVMANTGHQVQIGCINCPSGGACVVTTTGSANTGAADVFLWQADSQAGSFPTSPIPTTAAAATRARDDFAVDVGATAPAGNQFSLAVTFVPEWGGSNAPGGYPTPIVFDHISASDTTAGTLLNSPSTSGASWRAFTSNTTPASFTTSTNAVSISAVTAYRGYAYADGSNLNGAVGGVSFTASGALSGSWSPARYGAIGGTTGSDVSVIGGLVYGVCFDPSPSRCR